MGKRSHSERQRAWVLATELGISYTSALRQLRSAAASAGSVGSGNGVAVSGDAGDVPAWRLVHDHVTQYVAGLVDIELNKVHLGVDHLLDPEIDAVDLEPAGSFMDAVDDLGHGTLVYEGEVVARVRVRGWAPAQHLPGLVAAGVQIVEDHADGAHVLLDDRTAIFQVSARYEGGSQYVEVLDAGAVWDD